MENYEANNTLRFGSRLCLIVIQDEKRETALYRLMSSELLEKITEKRMKTDHFSLSSSIGAGSRDIMNRTYNKQ